MCRACKHVVVSLLHMYAGEEREYPLLLPLHVMGTKGARLPSFHSVVPRDPLHSPHALVHHIVYIIHDEDVHSMIKRDLLLWQLLPLVRYLLAEGSPLYYSLHEPLLTIRAVGSTVA